VEEVTGQHRRRLGTQERGPGWSAASRRWLDAVTAQDRPHARRCEANTHRGQLTLDSPIAPGRVLRGQPQHQRDRARGQRRPARPGTSVRPSAPDQVSMPAATSRAGRRTDPAQPSIPDGSARPGPHGRRPAMTDGSLDGEGSPLYGAASQPRWPVRLVPCGGAGVTGVGARTPRRERATPWPIFASPVPPRKVQVDGLDRVFGTHRLLRDVEFGRVVACSEDGRGPWSGAEIVVDYAGHRGGGLIGLCRALTQRRLP
jgi:hypothetical protein